MKEFRPRLDKEDLCLLLACMEKAEYGVMNTKFSKIEYLRLFNRLLTMYAKTFPDIELRK